MTSDEKLDQIIAEQVRFREELTKTRADVMARLDRQANYLTEIKEDIGVNMARIERAIATNDQIKDDMRDLWRQILRLRTEVDELRAPL